MDEDIGVSGDAVAVSNYEEIESFVDEHEPESTEYEIEEEEVDEPEEEVIEEVDLNSDEKDISSNELLSSSTPSTEELQFVEEIVESARDIFQTSLLADGKAKHYGESIIGFYELLNASIAMSEKTYLGISFIQNKHVMQMGDMDRGTRGIFVCATIATGSNDCCENEYIILLHFVSQFYEVTSVFAEDYLDSIDISISRKRILQSHPRFNELLQSMKIYFQTFNAIDVFKSLIKVDKRTPVAINSKPKARNRNNNRVLIDLFLEDGPPLSKRKRNAPQRLSDVPIKPPRKRVNNKKVV